MQAIKAIQQIKKTPLTKNKSGALFKMKQNFQNYKTNKGYTLKTQSATDQISHISQQASPEL